MLLAKGYLSDKLPQIYQVSDFADAGGVWTWEDSTGPGLSVCVLGYTKQSVESMWLRYRRQVTEDPVSYMNMKKRHTTAA